MKEELSSWLPNATNETAESLSRAAETNVIVITGASGGLGGALARAYAEPGHILGLLGRDAQRLEETAERCRHMGAQVRTGTVDVRDTDKMTAWLRSFDALHTVDLVIANAGVSSSNAPNGAVEAPELAAQTVGVNLVGVINTISPLLPVMRNRRHGQVAIIASLAALYPLTSTPAYNASKAGVVAYGRSLAPALAKDGLHICVVYPGFVRTPMSARVRGRKPLTLTADAAAELVKKGLARGHRTIVFPRSLALGMRALNLLPAGLAAVLARPFLYTVDHGADHAGPKHGRPT